MGRPRMGGPVGGPTNFWLGLSVYGMLDDGREKVRRLCESVRACLRVYLAAWLCSHGASDLGCQCSLCCEARCWSARLGSSQDRSVPHTASVSHDGDPFQESWSFWVTQQPLPSDRVCLSSSL